MFPVPFSAVFLAPCHPLVRRRFKSIAFVVRADACEQDGFLSLMANKLKDNAQIVSGTARL
jgi:hypothetical protein